MSLDHHPFKVAALPNQGFGGLPCSERFIRSRRVPCVLKAKTGVSRESVDIAPDNQPFLGVYPGREQRTEGYLPHYDFPPLYAPLLSARSRIHHRLVGPNGFPAFHFLPSKKKK